jgi:hypothetical protein
MMNLITRLGWERGWRRIDVQKKPERTQRTLRNLFQRSQRAPRFFREPLKDTVSELVDYLLFVDEQPLTAAVKGSSGFAERFAAEGPRDHRGRSLRQLDLTSV